MIAGVEHLPNEVLYRIASNCSDPKGLLSLASANRVLKAVFSKSIRSELLARLLVSQYSSESSLRARYPRCCLRRLSDIKDPWFSYTPAWNVSPFTWFVYHGDVDVVRLMLRFGADQVASRESMAFEYAAAQGHIEIVKLLLPHTRNVATVTAALPLACCNGHLEVVRMLLDAGADVRSNNDDPLRIASRRGHFQVVELLLQNGADVAAGHGSLLYWSCFDGLYEMVRVLLEYGADVHSQNGTALRWAAQNGHVQVVKVLLSFGANPNVDNGYPIVHSSIRGHYEVVKAILQYKPAQVYLDRAWVLAKQHGHTDICNLLRP